ncbi:hypothetical protein HYW20_02085 [Candidatus Woesearchaeota archaeon]|nr:hypothetical protein [Candidatus Woesearchaeota archaeon]
MEKFVRGKNKMEKKKVKEEGKGKKILHGILAGIIPSMLLYIMLGYVFIGVQDVTKTSASYGFSFFIIWALFIYWSYRADVVRRIWGRSLLLSAIFSFLLPISMLVFGARVTASQTNDFAVAGSAIGTGIAVVFVGFLMLLLGLAFSLGAYFTYKPLRK